MESWKPILDGTYEVSDLGRVRRARFGLRSDATVGRLIKPVLMKRHGYMQITLARKTYRLHRLIAAAFLGPANGREVNHKDTIKTNNVLSNLEYMTHAEHELHTAKNGLKANGARNFNSKLTEELVVKIRRLRWTDKTARRWAKKLGVTTDVIVRARRGINWKHVKEKPNGTSKASAETLVC